jgi:hypothetical protein
VLNGPENDSTAAESGGLANVASITAGAEYDRKAASISHQAFWRLIVESFGLNGNAATFSKNLYGNELDAGGLSAPVVDGGRSFGMVFRV